MLLHSLVKDVLHFILKAKSPEISPETQTPAEYSQPPYTLTLFALVRS